jgi:hypothetical protein
MKVPFPNIAKYLLVQIYYEIKSTRRWSYEIEMCCRVDCFLLKQRLCVDGVL